MKKILYICCVAVTFTACQKKQQFTIDGIITDASNSTLYLEQTTPSGNVCLDSVVLKDDGKFRFRQPRAEYPDIYQLRLNTRKLLLAVDSTEHITISTSSDSLSLTDHIQGSEKTLQVTALRRSLLAGDIAAHRELQKKTIMDDPRSIVAYYALLQSKDGRYLLSPYNSEDLPYFRTVATAFNAFMPEYYRSKALYKQVLSIINEEKAAQAAQLMQQFIEESDNAFLEITLPDESGKLQSLSQFKGKLTVLDFSSVAMPNSAAYLFDLKDVYNKYHSKGVQLFQVSADRNFLLWQQTAENLPWTTVRSEQGPLDQCFLTYNVQRLPAVFLLNKKGEVIGRFTSFDDLSRKIEQCLK